MAKMIMQIDLLSKHVMGGGLKLVNVVRTSSGKFPKHAKFEALFNEEVQYLGNHMGGTYPNYKRQSGN